MQPKIIIIPGNGSPDIDLHNWYAWTRDKLRSLGFEVIAQNMPDPDLARKEFWLPHIKNEFKADENTIIIGHSSGAVATLRYLENEKLLGAIIVGASYTDLGEEEEKLSGYFDDPWQWEKIKNNAKWIVQFASKDDPYIPIEEPRFINEKINSQYYEFTDRGHFGSMHKPEKTFPEIIEVILKRFGNKSPNQSN